MRAANPIFFTLLLAPALFTGTAPQTQYVYFSENPKPPLAQREPPYSGTRRQIEKKFYYLNIRYPYQSQRQFQDGLFMKFSVGNELQEPIRFNVLELELRHGDQSFPVTPYFYDTGTGEKKEGLQALQQIRLTITPNLHREISVVIPSAVSEFENLNLHLVLEIELPGKTEKVDENIPLYRGFYTLS